MNIILTGYSGFLGSHLYNFLKKKNTVTKFNLRKYKKLTKKNIFFFLNKKFKKNTVIINCASNLKPLNKNDFFINVHLPEIFSDYAKKKKIRFIHISTINTLIKERKDAYSLSKKKGEIYCKRNTIIRLPLIIKKVNNILLPEGQLSFFFKYLDSINLPIYPFIYPGTLYKPMDISDVCEKILLILNKEKNSIYLNLQGKKIISSYKLFKIICSQNNKLCLKVPTQFLKKIFPNFVKNFLYKNTFLQQLLNIKNFI